MGQSRLTVVQTNSSSTRQIIINTVRFQTSDTNARQKDAQGGYRTSMQGARMSGRSTPLAGYPEQYRMEGRMGWLAAFGTAGYPDGENPRVRTCLC